MVPNGLIESGKEGSMQISKEAENKLLDEVSRVREILVLRFPFWGSIALNLKPRAARPGDGVTTAAVAPDGTLVVNADFWDSLPDDIRLTLITHECGHPAFNHFSLMGKWKHERANRAADYALNPLLLEAGFKAIPGWMDNYRYHDKTAEAIAKMLKDEAEYDGEGEGDGESGGESGEGKVKNGMRPDLAETELGKKAASGDPSAAEELANQNAQNLANAAEQARQKGSLPGMLEKAINEVIHPKLSTADYLRRFMGSKGPRIERNMLRPSKRSEACGVHIPSRKSSAPTVAVIMDTSGSMSDKQYSEAMGLIEKTADELRIDLMYIECDTQIKKVRDSVTSQRDIGDRKGYGGSNFTPAFDYLQKEGFEGVIVAVTDGYIDVPRQQPNGGIQGVLWVLSGRYHTVPAEWGDTMEFEPTK